MLVAPCHLAAFAGIGRYAYFGRTLDRAAWGRTIRGGSAIFDATHGGRNTHIYNRRCRRGHTCAQVKGGGAKCWGRNYFGELGDGTRIDRSTPVDVVGLESGVTAFAMGMWHTCALTAGGESNVGEIIIAASWATTLLNITAARRWMWSAWQAG